MRRGGTSLGHETSEVGVEDSHIFYRCHDSDVSIWSDNHNRTGATVDPKCRISPSAGVEREVDIIDENSKPPDRYQSCDHYPRFKKPTLSNEAS